MPATPFQPRDPDFVARVHASFATQRAMHTLGATLESVEPGVVTIALPHCDDLTQQHGYLHAGIITAVVDSACGYAALTLMEAGAEVLSVEFKMQLLAPAKGARFVAEGRVVRSGRTLTVVSGELRGDAGEVFALLNGTMIAQRERP